MAAMLVTADTPIALNLDDLTELRADLRDICATLYEERVDYLHIDGQGRFVGAYLREDDRDLEAAAYEPSDDGEALWHHLLRDQLAHGARAHRAITDDWVTSYALGGFDLWL